MSNVLKNFSRLTDSALASVVDKIAVNLPKSPLCAQIYPSFGVFEAAANDFSAKLAAAADGGKLAIAQKNEARSKLVTTLVAMAKYIEVHSDGTDSAILLTGFVPTKVRTPRSAPSVPQDVRVDEGKLSGQAVVRCNAVRNAAIYEVRYCLQGEKIWQYAPPSVKCTILIEGFFPGSVVCVEVRAMNGHGYSNWSDGAAKMIR